VVGGGPGAAGVLLTVAHVVAVGVLGVIVLTGAVKSGGAGT
jgi:hypothetical protein